LPTIVPGVGLGVLTPSRRPNRLRSDAEGAQQAANITLRQHVRRGRAVQACLFAPQAVFEPRQSRNQFGFGAESIPFEPIKHRSKVGQQRDMLILVLPIRTEDHSGGAPGFTVSESKIVGDGKQGSQLSAVRPRKPEGISGLRLRLQRAAHF
jgi:hypothetical protein